ncbi:MAG: hypothetical protein JSU67_10490 [Gammaproteobacteria bacterium]|nr:MAG: hypothetical protein JSU67_10490 [Gammaproteobacteria bacterium]
MNEDITMPGYDGSDLTDVTSNTLITDITHVVSCAVGKNRHEYRRQIIREELVREHFDQQQAVSPRIRSRLLRLFKLNY